MTSVEILAQKVIKYSNIDRENAQINLKVPFLLWQEWVDEAMEINENQLKLAFEYGKTLAPFDSFEDFLQSLKNSKKD